VGAPPMMPPGGGGAPPGAPPSPQLATILGALSSKAGSPGQDLASQTSQLQGSDPTMVLRQLKSIKDALGVLFVKVFQGQPHVASEVSNTIKAIDKAIKHATEGEAVSGVVGSEKPESGGPQPIQFGPAQTGQNAQPNSSMPAT
jgi:hypothetical protein